MEKSADCYTRSEQLQARQILGIDNADRHFVVIDYDQIVDPMAFEQVENFDRELVFVHRHRVQGHEIGHETLPDVWIGLEVSRKISVREYPE